MSAGFLMVDKETPEASLRLEERHAFPSTSTIKKEHPQSPTLTIVNRAAIPTPWHTRSKPSPTT
jgi:hypothetical protein